jgi:hypothetical protein
LFFIFKVLAEDCTRASLTFSIPQPPRKAPTLQLGWANLHISGDWLVRAVLCGVVIFLPTSATTLNLLLWLWCLDYNFFFLLHFLDNFELWTGAPVVSYFSTVATSTSLWL